jgi:hypothetical protein
MSSQQRNRAAARHARHCNARAKCDTTPAVDNLSGKTTIVRDLLTRKPTVVVDPETFDEHAFKSEIERLHKEFPGQKPTVLLYDDAITGSEPLPELIADPEPEPEPNSSQSDPSVWKKLFTESRHFNPDLGERRPGTRHDNVH